MSKLTIGVNGAGGRMGRRVVALIAADNDCELGFALEKEGEDNIGQDAGDLAGIGKLGVALSSDFTAGADVMIDFSGPDSSLMRLKSCAEAGVAAVVGTTGFDDKQERILKKISRHIPLMHAPNMSLGVNLIFKVAAQIASMLGEGYDIEIIESHHRHKKDAPSGTALKMAESVCRNSGRSFDHEIAYGRQGITGPRKPGEIGVHAVRGGDIVGEHTIIYAGEGERVELTHRAGSRDLFAAGAIKAAKFTSRMEPGLYDMQDLLDETE